MAGTPGTPGTPFGKHGVHFTAEWTDDSVLPSDTCDQYNFRGDYFDIAVFGDCYECIENGNTGTRQVDLSWVTISGKQDSENIKTCDLVCPCSSHLGSKPVGIESIFVRFHRDVALQIFIKAQCFGCSQKAKDVPSPPAHPLGLWHRLSFLGCCANAKVKLVSLKFRARQQASPPASVPRADERHLICKLCFCPIEDQALGCVQCAEPYHRKCYKEWRDYRKRCSEAWCLSCHKQVKQAPVMDLHARNKKRKKQSLDKVNQENTSPNKGICEVVNPKRTRHSVGSNASAAKTADVCFLMDCTGSMDEWIDAAKYGVSQVAEMSCRLSGVSCRFAFVGYRDYDEDERYSILDFTSDFTEFGKFLKHVQARGGFDECEDLLGGMGEALRLQWQSDVRTLYLVCDAPCHGKEYHGGMAYDEYPIVPGHLAADVLFQKLNAKKVFLHGFRVGTDPKHGQHVWYMMNTFRAIWKQISGHAFPVQDLGSQTSLFSDSISGSLHNVVQRVREEIVVLDSEGWSTEIEKNAKWIAGKLGIFEQPQSRNLLKRVLNWQEAELVFKPAKLQIAAAHFNQDGNNKYVFHCRDAKQPQQRLVAKVYNTKSRLNSQPVYLQELEVSSRAEHFVDAFNKSRVSEFHIVHVPVRYFYVDVDTRMPPHYLGHYLVEDFLEGKMEKFNSNSGWTYRDVVRGVGEVAQAFSHFTYKLSKGKEILVDVQGVVVDSRLFLHDVARHTLDEPSPLEPMNHGPKGIVSFFKSHKCRETCKKLQIQSYWPDMSCSEQALPVTRESLRNSEVHNQLADRPKRSSQCNSIPEDDGEESEEDEEMTPEDD